MPVCSFPFFFIEAAFSADVTFEGSWTCKPASNDVKIEGGYICNNMPISYPGGFVLVFLTSSRYKGGAINGYMIGQTHIDSIEAHEKQYFYEYIKYDRKLPRTGYYYITIALRVGGDRIGSFVSWENPIYFTNKTQTKVEELRNELARIESDIQLCEWQLQILNGREFVNKNQEKMRYILKKADIELKLINLGYDTKTDSHNYFSKTVTWYED